MLPCAREANVIRRYRGLLTNKRPHRARARELLHKVAALAGPRRFKARLHETDRQACRHSPLTLAVALALCDLSCQESSCGDCSLFHEESRSCRLVSNRRVFFRSRMQDSPATSLDFLYPARLPSVVTLAASGGPREMTLGSRGDKSPSSRPCDKIPNFARQRFVLLEVCLPCASTSRPRFLV